MPEARTRQLVDDLEEVVGRNLERRDQRLLHRSRQLVEAPLVIAAFEDMDLGEWHFESPIQVASAGRSLGASLMGMWMSAAPSASMMSMYQSQS